MSDGETTWTYTYDVNGMRTSRTDGTTAYTYVYNGSQLTQMTVGTSTYHFTYDASGRPMSISCDDATYYYAVNLQGDVVAILDDTGFAVVSYTYDAWGNLLVTTGAQAETLGVLNPLRYRGYVYDTETGLYYLQTRYYNPEWGRFINADGYTSTGQGLLGNNMFAYCLNNPVLLYDPSGAVPRISSQFYFSDDDGGGGGLVLFAAGVAAGSVILLGPMMDDLLYSASHAIDRARQEVYEYSRMVRAELAEASRKVPHVHHIVPVGNFSSRSVAIQEKISKMHQILADAEINRWADPSNLMLVSAGTHASLHTDAYIEHVYSYIAPAAGDQEAIYAALFALRLEIAAWDIYASGY